MATFNRTDIGMGMITPGGVNWRPHAAFEYPAGSGNDLEESMLAELDDIKDDIANENGVTNEVWRARRMPEGIGIWIGTQQGTSTPTGGSAAPSDFLFWGLKQRGVVPSFNFNFHGGQMYGADGKYVGAPTSGGTRSTEIGTIDDWSDTDPDRNFAQRILDGEYDTWIDHLAKRIEDFKNLSSDPDAGPGDPVSNLNDKDEPYSAYDKVILRFMFESNSKSMPCSLPWVDDGNGQRGWAREQWLAAWCYVVDRFRGNALGEATLTNARFFLCFIHPGEPYHKKLTFSNSNKKLWHSAMNSRVDFLGIDSYGGGFGVEDHVHEDYLDGKLVLRQKGTPFQNPTTSNPSNGKERTYWNIFDLGGKNIPMIVGEWGVRYDDKKRKWSCAADSNKTDNDYCRGHFIKDSLEDIIDKRAGNQSNRTGGDGKWKALKGLFYMAKDLFRMSGSNDAARMSGDEWALWDGTHNNYGSTTGPDDFDFEDRPYLGSSTASGLPGSYNRAYARYASTINSYSELRGRGGAFFDV